MISSHIHHFHDLDVVCVSVALADESAQLLTEKNWKTFSCLGARGVKPWLDLSSSVLANWPQTPITYAYIHTYIHINTHTWMCARAKCVYVYWVGVGGNDIWLTNWKWHHLYCFFVKENSMLWLLDALSFVVIFSLEWIFWNCVYDCRLFWYS